MEYILLLLIIVYLSINFL